MSDNDKVEEALWHVEHDPLSDRGDWDEVLAAEVRRLREVEKALRDEIERARARNEDWHSDL